MTFNDIEYLINPIMLDKLNKKKLSKKNSNEETLFYKKRILHLIKNLLNNKNENINNKSLLDSYEIFINNAVNHFKMIDTKDILQLEYENINKTNNSNNDKISIVNNNLLDIANDLVINENKYSKSITIPQCWPILKKNKNTITHPIKKKINLKDPILKLKGL